MWKPEHRLAADRRGLRYPSDLTDAEWAIVAAMIPPGRHGGRRRSVNVREVLNGIFYVLWTGCQWKALPKDLPPKSTVHDYLELWNWDGTLERIHHTLYVAVREEEGREASPTVAIIELAVREGRSKRGVAIKGADEAIVFPVGLEGIDHVVDRDRVAVVVPGGGAQAKRGGRKARGVTHRFRD